MISWVSLLALVAGCPGDAEAKQSVKEPFERVVYELVVERAGSRSQGIRGILYDEDGRERVPASVNEVVRAQFGSFRFEGCTYLWSVCGYLRDAGGFSDRQADNDPSLSGAIRFRVIARSYADDLAFRGELLSAEQRMATDEGSLATPMGVFRQTGGMFAGFAWSGWVPESWLQASVK